MYSPPLRRPYLPSSRLISSSTPLPSSTPTWKPLPLTPLPSNLTSQTQPIHIRLPSPPARRKWFKPHPSHPTRSTLNTPYLQPHGSTLLPLEFTTPSTFHRASAPFSIFLTWAATATSSTPSRFYLAQASLSDLPAELQADLPTPEVIKDRDIYAANLWMGVAPTETPLHRDPNPNLFVQLAGRKAVRLVQPGIGEEIWERVRERVGGMEATGRFRGEEMMRGEEREGLEKVIWSGGDEAVGEVEGCEVVLEAGEGLFIPKGWWHAVKGVGKGVSASVNWWFR